ncbi:calcium-binding protein [Asticcacaulis sp. AC402]|uniref:calcium-binding protein n=1 Tax=Asticcacaulis sp. AC402 TaxID=1282361 RepID=UPI000415882D|nr:calcium-binding protein [Asticcacaulis sp. AC402]
MTGINVAKRDTVLTVSVQDPVLQAVDASVIDAVFVGGTGNDTYAGGNDNDTISGAGGNDSLSGSGGNDRLDGGSGNDTLVGGTGNDTYYIDQIGIQSGDQIVELAGEGHDLVFSTRSFNLTGLHVEDATLLGTSDNSLTGNSLNNILTGNSGYNTLSAGAGNDTVFGSSGRDTMLGGDGADVLNGGTGRDSMTGGAGNDTYYVDEASDRVIEVAREGHDLVYAYSTFTLTNEVEDLTLLNSDNIQGTGNVLNNVMTGNSGANWLYGQGGNDSLNGAAGDDRLDGGDGNDTLVGGEGFDSLQGFVGNDSLSGGDSNDSLYGYSGDDTLLGEGGNDYLYGDAGNDTLMGDAGNDTLFAGGGRDLLMAGAGNDRLQDNIGEAATLVGGSGNDTYAIYSAATNLTEVAGGGLDEIWSSLASYTLGEHFENLRVDVNDGIGIGNAKNNVITGNNAANWLDGATGADTLVGLNGNDTYVIDSGDTVVELDGGGTDQISASFSYGLADFVENLALIGTGNLEGTGNSMSNSLTGNAGNNLLNGDGGSDTMIGGLGDDSYYVQSAGDVVIEAAGEGKDLIVSWVSYALGGTVVENLTLIGPAGLSATGNSLGNTLTGNDGNNILNGLGARDVLIGGLGADTFLFTTGSGRDRINDFSAAQNDRININAYTAGVANGAIVTQAGADVVIALGVDDVITVLNAVRAEVLSHIVW